MPSPFLSLTRSEAESRAALLDVLAYDVHLDLAASEATFESVTRIRFRSRGGATFADLKPVRVASITLDGRELGADVLDRGRIPLETDAGEHELVVRATMPFRNDGEGLHRSVDPADGRHYVYGMSFMDAAPSVFACFDQPDLKAPYTLRVVAPADWHVVGNAPLAATERQPDGSVLWTMQESQPLSTYFVTLIAGPYHLVRDEHDGIPLSLSVRASMAADLDKDAEEILTITKACFDEFHRLFGIRYPFGDYHQAFVPEFNAGAMENPGCITLRDPLIFTSRVTRGERIKRATTIAHEMAHQWFGNIVTPRWWDDLWLNESFAEYMGNRVTADVTDYTDAWVFNAYQRRQWGLVADERPSTHPVAGNGAVDASAALQDFDGISYAKGSSILKQVNARLGDEVFFAGAVDHFTRHRFGNATMHDLFDSWQRALDERRPDSGLDLDAFTRQWLLTAGPDVVRYDRERGALLRVPPAEHPAEREHTIRVVRADDSGWESVPLTLGAAETAYDGAGRGILIDPYEESWVAAETDEESLPALAALLPRAHDEPLLRAGVWNNVRTAYRHARLSPDAVIGLAEVGIADEDVDTALVYLLPWLLGSVVPLASDGALARVHAAALARATSAEPGSTLQLAAFQGAVASADSAEQLRTWLTAPPAGVEVDLDLRWRILVRLATLGRTDRAELDAALAEEPTNRSRIEHTRAVASLPDAEAKAYAWSRFTGETDVPNYELEAAGLGMWRAGQEALTAPYAERYFADLPATVGVRSGWVLADAAAAFFPTYADDEATLARTEALLADESLDLSLRRRLTDAADDTRVRIAIRAAFPRA